MHRKRQPLLLVICLVLLSFGFVLAEGPCDSPEHRQFDFWLGEWQVFRPGGILAGTNRIEMDYGGCVIHENYSTESGYRGESLNVYDASRGLWHQTWVDNTGLLLLLEGGFDGESMVLESEGCAEEGAGPCHRITWTPNADGSVRQHWQTRTDDGEWKTAFDGLYVKH